MSFIETPGGGETQRREKNLPEDVIIATHQRSVIFHEQEVREGESRGMDPRQIDHHRQQFQTCLSALVDHGVLEMIPVKEEKPAAVIALPVPQLALPELALAV